MLILLGVLVMGVLVTGGWVIMRGRNSETRTEAGAKKVLTTLPTSKPEANTPIPPTPTTVKQKGNLPLTITSPGSGTIVKTSTVKVTGTTLSGADVGINDKDVIADKNGNFSATIAIEEGENEIMIVVTDEQGNFAEEIILVTRDENQ